MTVSVVVIGYAPAELLDRCLAALGEQQRGVDGVDVTVVAHLSHQGTSFAPVRARFANVPWIDAPLDHNVARMRGLGIAKTAGEYVVLLEGDCIPAPGWLDRISRVRPVAALGGAIEPASFRRSLDWAAYFCEFSQFMAPLAPVPAQLPGTNVVYRRSALPPASRLEAEGMFETFLNSSLGQARLSADSTLVVRHARTWRAGAALETRFHHGRVFAALRVRDASPGRRLMYLPLALALPLVLALRVFRDVFARRRHVGRALLAAPWILALSAAWAFGEVAGYAAGPGSSLDRWR